MTVRFLSVAEAEFAEAAEYYEEIDQGLGERFIDHVVHAIGYIEKHPHIAPLIELRIRKISLKKFPYNILYYSSNNELIVVAIAHQKRKPLYWRDRLES